MSWTIVGAGAIGGTLAHALAGSGHEVTLVDTDRAHVAAVTARGLSIRRPDGIDDTVGVHRAVHPEDADDLTDLDRVIIATKSQHTVTAADWTAKRLSPSGFVVSAQNGVNEPVIAERVGAERVLGAFVNIFADYLEPGVVRDGGLGALAVGLPGSGAPDARVLEVAEDLRAYGPVVATANLAGYRWSKAGFGAVLGVTTLVDEPMADVVAAYPDVAAAAAAEKVEQAVAAGVVLEPFDAWEPYGFRAVASTRVRTAATDRLVSWLRTMPKDRSGVFRDIAVRRRPRETHPLGYAPAAGASTPTPVYDAVAARIGEIEAGRAEFGRHHLDALRRHLTTPEIGAPPVRHRPTALAFAGLLLTAGCSAGSSDDEGSAGGGEPVDGGTLSYGLQADPVCLDPRQGGLTVSLTVTRSVVDSLTDQDPETGEIQPWLAQTWESNADSSSFTFHLRDGVTFSDGTPLDAAAVKTNFDDIAELGALAALPAQYLTGYRGTTVLDPSTVRIDFTKPNAQFLQASSSMSLGLLSPKSLQDRTPEQLCQGDYSASGPFSITKFVTGQSVRIEKRTGYAWAPGRAEHQGDAHLDAVDFTVVPEASVRSGSLVSRQLDAVGDLPAQSSDQVEGSGLQVLAKPNPGLTGSFFVNTTSGPLADPAVRQALLHVVDREQVADTVFFGQAPAATSLLSSVTPGYADVSDALTVDTEAAASLLDAAGWTRTGDATRSKGGQELRVQASYNPAIGTGQAVLELVQQQLSKVGIALDIEKITAAELTDTLTNRDYGLFYNSQVRPDPDVLWSQYSPDSPSNRHGGSDPELAQVLAQQRTTTDPAQRDPLNATAQQRIVADGFGIPVVESVGVFGVGKDVHGFGWEASGKPVFYDIWKDA